MIDKLGIEPIMALEWISSLLTPDEVLSDPDTGITGWYEIAPASVRSPYGIIRQLTAGADLTGLADDGPDQLIWVPCIMQVIIYDRVEPNYARIKPLAARAYSLLQRASGTTEDGVIFGAGRTLVYASTLVTGDAVERFVEQQFRVEARSD